MKKPKAQRTTIHLNLKSKWFNMILSGEKKEEYREIKPHFSRMFLICDMIPKSFCNKCNNLDCGNEIAIIFKKLPQNITFSNGYAKKRPQFEIELSSIEIGNGREEWGANKNEKYFVLKLGKILKTNMLCTEKKQ